MTGPDEKKDGKPSGAADPGKSDPGKSDPGKAEAMADIGAMFRGLGGLVEMLGSLVEQAEQVDKSGEFKVKGLGDQARGVYGFSVRTGLGRAPQVRRFGNINPTPRGPVVEDVREPLVDLYDEEDGLVVTAELPGVAEDEIVLTIEDDELLLETKGRHRYAKRIELPQAVDPASLDRSHRNGILQVKLRKI